MSFAACKTCAMSGEQKKWNCSGVELQKGATTVISICIFMILVLMKKKTIHVKC